ncbi:MAG: hypothetical protein JST48_05125 [Bacteroidetes bacterium]|nr:hypothetical protein [Bacteroidota bacterium]
MKYIFIKVCHMYDGLEFDDKRVCSIPDNTNPHSWAMKNIAKTYRDDLDENQSHALKGYFSFENGSHMVTIDDVRQIEKGEFDTLRKYL